MKRIVFILAAAISLASCESSDKQAGAKLSDHEKEKSIQDTSSYTSIQWLDKNPLDLGKTKEGAIVEVAFHFKNAGTKPLVISDVKAGCGCTVPEKPQQPFAPGEEGVIKATFNSKGYKGVASKHITVTANTNPNHHDLTFSVEVSE